MTVSGSLRAVALVAALALLSGLGPGVARAQTPRQERAQLEQRLRQRLGAVVRRELALTEEQARQLGDVNARFERDRRALAGRERQLRLQLRDEILGGDSADQGRVANALDRLVAVQRERVDLLASEQRELAKFLTPVQRAKYLAIQDQLRRRLEEARRQHEDGGAAPRMRRPGARLPAGPPG